MCSLSNGTELAYTLRPNEAVTSGSQVLGRAPVSVHLPLLLLLLSPRLEMELEDREEEELERRDKGTPNT